MATRTIKPNVMQTTAVRENIAAAEKMILIHEFTNL